MPHETSLMGKSVKLTTWNTFNGETAKKHSIWNMLHGEARTNLPTWSST